MTSTDSRLQAFIDENPSPTTDPGDRLAHVLACYSHVADQARLPTAPLSWGELRALQKGRKTPSLAAFTAKVRPDEWVVTATIDVYGPGIRTGLTGADLKELVAS